MASPLYTHVVSGCVPKLLCPITWVGSKGWWRPPPGAHRGLPKGAQSHANSAASAGGDTCPLMLNRAGTGRKGPGPGQEGSWAGSVMGGGCVGKTLGLGSHQECFGSCVWKGLGAGDLMGHIREGLGSGAPCLPCSPPRGHHPPAAALQSHLCGRGPQWTEPSPPFNLF